VLAELRPSARYLRGLRTYLRQPLRPEDAPQLVKRQLARREENFVRILERGVFENRDSVYGMLLRHAGIERGDLVRLVEDEGLESALGRLHREGVYVTLEEFKARRPITRPGLEIPVTEGDFDNPLLARHYEARSGASRSAGRRIVVDLDLLAHESAYHWMFLSAHGLSERPLAVWHTVPPGAAGLKCVLYEAKLGRSAERWFTQVPSDFGPGSSKYRLFTACTIAASRFWRRPVPAPEYAPADDPLPVVRWLGEKRAGGAPAVVSTTPSSAVRACVAAADAGIEISGTVFLVGGEPHTPAKDRLIANSGSRAVPVYAMAELGLLGIGCPASRAIDEVHIFSDKLAVLQLATPVAGGPAVAALLFTSLLPSCPKLMLNVDSGDYGVLETRACDCAFGAVGLSRRLSGVRSYEKLTSEGINYLGSDLITLLEETLPARFGGGPTDYQLVEEEIDGLPKVSIAVSPGVGGLDEEELVRTVLRALGSEDGGRQMARAWSEGQTLRVVRRQPYPGRSGKIQALHMIRSS
jgi:hypothetical protein